MAETTPAAKAYFTSSYVFGNGTTSTIALLVWKAVSEHLAEKHLPMTGEELSAATGLTPEQIADMFSQHYYNKFYGFRRFDLLEEWETWAHDNDVLFIPGVHDVPLADEPDDFDEDLDEDEEEAGAEEAEA